MRQGILEKASKDVTTWKARRCLLRPEALWYAKTADDPSSPSSDSCSASSPCSPPCSPSCSLSPSSSSSWSSQAQVSGSAKRQGRWTFIPLRDCVQLVAPPHDACSFLLQTRERSHYWKAKSQTERDAWLHALATQCISIREGDLLRDVERRIREGEERRASTMLQSLESMYRLDGTLSFIDTQELLAGFVVDFYRTLADRKEKREREEKARDGDRHEGGPYEQSEEEAESLFGYMTDDTAPPQFTLQQVLAYIRSYDPESEAPTGARHREGERGKETATEGGRREATKTAATERDADGGGKGRAKERNSEEHEDEDTDQQAKQERKEIREWLEEVIFPRFMGSSIIQRRIAQLAASRTVVSWGCDPLRSPLLCSLEHTGGLSR